MDFFTAVKTCFGKYATFAGRARRAEYWYFVLFSILVGIGAIILDSMFGMFPEGGYGPISLLLQLALILPGISVTVRRLHDGDRTGWWFWLYLIPIVGIVMMLIWVCSRGTAGDNRYGPDPLATSVA